MVLAAVSTVGHVGLMVTASADVYGPLLGAMIAMGFERILRGAPTKAGAAAAQGILDPNDTSGL